MDFSKQRKFLAGHSFYNKFLVMAEEEKAATFASTFASLENLLKVEFWAQTGV